MTVTRCRAKDKSTCRVHGHAHTQTAWFSVENLHQNYLVSQRTVEPVRINTKNVSHRAVTSSLIWDGEKPSWWEEYKTNAMADKQLPTTPELIDVIDSPAGPLAVVWQTESQAPQDRNVLDSGMAINACFYKSMATGELLGYVKMCYMDDSTVERSFGKDEFMSFRWMSRYSGRNYGFDDDTEDGTYGDRNLKGDALLGKRREVWLLTQKIMGSGFKNADGKYVFPYNMTEKDIPDDGTVLKDLRTFSRKLNKEVKSKRAFFATPYVDFSRVEEPLLGKGFGSALYIYTARKLGQQGKVLRASSLQTDEAQAAWASFAKRFPNNISSIDLDYFGAKSTAPVLDFRQ